MGPARSQLCARPAHFCCHNTTPEARRRIHVIPCVPCAARRYAAAGLAYFLFTTARTYYLKGVVTFPSAALAGACGAVLGCTYAGASAQPARHLRMRLEVRAVVCSTLLCYVLFSGLVLDCRDQGTCASAVDKGPRSQGSGAECAAGLSRSLSVGMALPLVVLQLPCHWLVAPEILRHASAQHTSAFAWSCSP